MRWPRSVGAFAAETLQIACTPFQNFMAVRLACANAGWAAKPSAATMAQTEVRIIPPWQVNGTLKYNLARRTKPDHPDRGRSPEKEGQSMPCTNTGEGDRY